MGQPAGADTIRSTWALAAADPDRTARVFYAALFRRDPTTKPLFVGNLDLQGRKLVGTLGFIVDHLGAPEVLMPAATDLAIRHVAYGVTADQYASVGDALIETFRTLLGPAFDAAAEEAWTRTYAGLAEAMVAAAYPG